MKIINTYLIPMIRKFGTIVETDLSEVIELENGMVFEVCWMKGNRSYRKMDRELFDRTLNTKLLEFV